MTRQRLTYSLAPVEHGSFSAAAPPLYIRLLYRRRSLLRADQATGRACGATRVLMALATRSSETSRELIVTGFDICLLAQHSKQTPRTSDH